MEAFDLCRKTPDGLGGVGFDEQATSGWPGGFRLPEFAISRNPAAQKKKYQQNFSINPS
jgi:hypothetical protein